MGRRGESFASVEGGGQVFVVPGRLAFITTACPCNDTSVGELFIVLALGPVY